MIEQSRYFAETVLELKILADRLSDGVGVNAGKFAIKHQILYLIYKNKGSTTKFLMDNLNIAKSNLALICNAMIREGFIEKQKINNQKEIFYYITVKGEDELAEKLKPIELIFESDKRPRELLSKVTKVHESIKSLKNS